MKFCFGLSLKAAVKVAWKFIRFYGYLMFRDSFIRAIQQRGGEKAVYLEVSRGVVPTTVYLHHTFHF